MQNEMKEEQILYFSIFLLLSFKENRVIYLGTNLFYEYRLSMSVQRIPFHRVPPSPPPLPSSSCPPISNFQFPISNFQFRIGDLRGGVRTKRGGKGTQGKVTYQLEVGEIYLHIDRETPIGTLSHANPCRIGEN